VSTLPRSGQLTPRCPFASASPSGPDCRSASLALETACTPNEHAKIYGALHARIPMVTADEQRAVQEENAKDDERFWEVMRDIGASSIEGHKALISSAETKVARQLRQTVKLRGITSGSPSSGSSLKGARQGVSP
jgi:hypothetical protein